MVLKLVGSPYSTCGLRVGIILHEKNVPFEMVPIDLSKREHKTPEYLEKQPFGQVPYLDDDGFILYESRAIARYIATKYADQGTRLIPTGLRENALFEQAVSIEVSNEKVFRRLKGLQPNEDLAKDHWASFSTQLDTYEQILSKQKYLAGDEITLVDLFYIPYTVKLFQPEFFGAGDLIESRPNLNRWWNDITSRESWQVVKSGIKSTV